MSEPLTGVGVSPGLIAGPVARMAGPPALTGSSVLNVSEALSAVAFQLRSRAVGEAAEILEAQTMMVEDPQLLEEAERLTAEGLDAARALDRAFSAHEKAMLELGGYFAERAADLEDLRNRAVAAALGQPMPGLPEPGHPYVLVADDLSPADTATLDSSVLAIVTQRGGPTSHTAILARARGIPAVVACPTAEVLADGELVAVDGSLGSVRQGVAEGEVTEIHDAFLSARARLRASRGPGRTADGHAVPLMSNIGSAADPVGEEGVGLFRTEFLFLDRRTAPSLEEQEAAYAAVFSRGGKVVVRTLDAGTDKPLPFLGLAEEENPALGIRGLRVDRVLPQVLDTQLDAIVRAAAAHPSAEVWVMAPMVTTWQEAAAFASRARERGVTRAGVMIEVPAAALMARELLEHVDFLSIGTNDLSQYTFAADRQHARLADLLDPWQPALLRLVGACARAGLEAGKPVGVCGEAAGDPRLAPVLVGLGVTSLSMSATSVPAVRESLAGVTLDQCRAAAGGVLSDHLLVPRPADLLGPDAAGR
ncbi:phosphoenolpyruvate--protein phosphotransferase [Streptosporangium canum]|uniref:phosphoenolpyruvate--protein phosphotransferase n=1 Tax=Streptosporangium canum TaxID=324952 RepID=UPI0034490735